MAYSYRFGFHWKAKSAANFQAHLLSREFWWLILLDCALLTRCYLFFTTTDILVLSHMKVVSSAVSYWINYVRIFSHTSVGFCPCTKSTVCALPGAKSFGRISPWNTSVKPVHHGVEHLSIVSIQLSIIHVFSYYEFTTLALCTRLLSFKTRSNGIQRTFDFILDANCLW